jgi:hypothetical protein
MITVTGVRSTSRPSQRTPSSASIERSIMPTPSSPSGDTSELDRPSRAAPIAVIAPPPGERRKSSASRSSPGAGMRSSPTSVRSRNAGSAQAMSTLN